MPTMPSDPVSALRAAVTGWHARLKPGLFGLACSGGADSMALADAAIAEVGASHVVIIHIDHGLSPTSADVADGVSAWARGQGAAAVIRRIDVPRRASLEAAAREARYAALETIRQELGASAILLGHTARDQAETVLMRIVRGTGPAGLAGIPAQRGPFVRPLLELPRDVIDAYVAARGLPTWSDPMNADLRIARVRFREKLIPALRAENPALDEALCRLAASAREWLTALDTIAEPLCGFPIASCARLAGLDPAVRKRGYALALEREGLSYDAVHLDAIDELVQRPSAGEASIDLPGARIVRSYDELALVVQGREEPAAAVEPLVAPAGYELRVWRAGDRMKPARLKGKSRKLSDLFIDAKVPREVRSRARVLVRTQDRVIVWAEHVGLAFGESPTLVPKPQRRPGSF